MRVEFGFYPMQTGHYDPTLPDMTITEWYVKVGDVVSEGDKLLYFECDKISDDLVSPASGRIAEIYEEYSELGSLWESGNAEELPDGRILYRPPLGIIETDVQDAGEEEQISEEPTAAPPDVADEAKVRVTKLAQQIAQKNGISTEELKASFPDKLKITREDAEELVEARAVEQPSDTVEVTDGNIHAVQAARRIAREKDVDLSKVKGTGDNGLILVSDVEGYIREASDEKAKMPEDVLFFTPSSEWRTIALNLEKGSKTTIAAGERKYDMRKLLKFKEEHSLFFEPTFGVRLRIWAPIVLAITRVLAQNDFALFNGYWHIEDENDRRKDKIALYTSVHLGMSYDRGMKATIDRAKLTISGQRLRILTLHDAQEYSTHDFLGRLHNLLEDADYDTTQAGGKLQKTSLRDWTGWSFIFNNVGAAGHTRGNSLLTPKMSAMLNMGIIEDDGKATFQIFFDHRMIDGVPSTEFLDAVYEELMKKVLPELTLECWKK